MSIQPRLRYLLILDFEATCGDDIKGQNEIIEFPTLVYDLEADEVQATFHEYIRPVLHPTLTQFCKNLTGIAQEVVDVSDPFPVVWNRFQDFLQSNESIADSDSFIFVTCGNWDLRSMLPRQLDISDSQQGRDETGALVPPYNRWINLKTAYRKHYRLRYELGMSQMLQGLKMSLEGRQHSGIDDCKNILRIVRQMREHGWEPRVEV